MPFAYPHDGDYKNQVDGFLQSLIKKQTELQLNITSLYNQLLQVQKDTIEFKQVLTEGTPATQRSDGLPFVSKEKVKKMHSGKWNSRTLINANFDDPSPPGRHLSDLRDKIFMKKVQEKLANHLPPTPPRKQNDQKSTT